MAPSRAACALAVLAFTPTAAVAAPLLRSAEVRIAFHSPTACTVDVALEVDETREVEHRVEITPGARVELVEIRGATSAVPQRDVGHTRVLRLRLGSPAYALRYTVEQPADRADRCPLWIPVVPADGRTQAVRIAVSLPPGATTAGTMPAFRWSGVQGTATLGHLPAFVRVAYALPGEPAPRDVARVMDAVSILALAAATIVWGLARKRRHE